MLGSKTVTTKLTFKTGNTRHRTRARKGTLRSDRTCVPVGRYVATELESKLGRNVATELEPKLGRYVATESKPNLGRYVATERSFRSVATYRPSVRSARSLRSGRALPKRRYDISPYILDYPLMLSPEDRSEPISRSPPF
ncbi:hypothetical protein F2Q69_00012950 [Brassica cretica]|uniref:Uncharacterized protein n=1 Tax=Brassica cretica TaxID=69181 RepID=A0A8S9QNU6_BRACR|nr:hypothetical protein F2Q69_00012950 [Brassica cretica]